MKIFPALRSGVVVRRGRFAAEPRLLWLALDAPHEINDIHFENVTQTSVDVVWTTAHPSTSQVMIARSTDYEPERWAPESPDKALVTTHRVTVDHLIPYNPKNNDGQYYIYVASVDGKGELSTAPGPQTPDGKNPFIPMRTRPTDTAGEPKFDFYILGPDEVYAGHDMYFLVQSVLISGPVENLYVINQGGYNNDTDGVVKSIGPQQGKSRHHRRALLLHLDERQRRRCQRADARPRAAGMGYCNDLNNNIRDLTFRLRTKPNTAPGKYSRHLHARDQRPEEDRNLRVHGTAAGDCAAASAVDDEAHSRPRHLGKGDDRARQEVVRLSRRAEHRRQFHRQLGLDSRCLVLRRRPCLREHRYLHAPRPDIPNHAVWQHCAINMLSPYANWQVANNAAMAGYATFTYGMGMNYLRTHDDVMRKAISMLATVGPQHVGVGQVDPWGIRENAYRSNAWMTDEMLGAPRWPLLDRNIDKIMGNLNIMARGGGGAVHPFMEGLAMETLIHWYELNMAEGHPDYRVIPVIKQALDGLWKYSWMPKQHMFDYNRFRVATEPESGLHELEQPGIGGVRLVLAADRRQPGPRSRRRSLRARLRRPGVRLERQAVQPGVRVQLRLRALPQRH